MTRYPRWPATALVVAALLTLPIGCSGGGGGGGGGGPGPPPVSVSGTITYDYVPTSMAGLDYANTTAVPARGVLVEAIRAQDNHIFDTAITDDSGAYSVNVSPSTLVYVRVKSQIRSAGGPTWDVRVVDNTSGDALYAVVGVPFGSGTVDTTGHDLHFPSGWGGASYTTARLAAPFAILDVAYEALRKTAAADPTFTSPPLVIHWSVRNVPVFGSPANGQIGTTYFDPVYNEMWVLGEEDNDTDEHDAHVIGHELGHFFEGWFPREDWIGGPHWWGDILDPRVSFSEGFSNAFSGMILDLPVYIDTMGAQQATVGVDFDLEDNSLEESIEGWGSETSVQVIVYDLYDTANDGVDSVSLGFGPIYDAVVNDLGPADSFPTIFSFTHYLKQNNPGAAIQIDDIVAGESITTSLVDEWDSTGTETNNHGLPISLPIYTEISVGAMPVVLCTTGSVGNYNMIGNRKFFYFDVTSSGTYRIRAVPDSNGDPVIAIYKAGLLVAEEDRFGPGATENLSLILGPGTYACEVYDYDVVNGGWTDTECFDVDVR